MGSLSLRLAAPFGATLASAVAGCGSASVAELPPPARADASPQLSTRPEGSVTRISRDQADLAATPARSALFRDGRLRVALDPRARTLRLVGAGRAAPRDEIPVGVGPTQVGCAARGPCFVTDTTGDALLVVRVAADGASLRLTRRVYLAGAPYAIAVDRARRRTWVTLSARNEVVELGAHGRPHVLERHAAVRQPDGVAVDTATGDVLVTGTRPPRRQRLTSPSAPSR